MGTLWNTLLTNTFIFEQTPQRLGDQSYALYSMQQGGFGSIRPEGAGSASVSLEIKTL